MSEKFMIISKKNILSTIKDDFIISNYILKNIMIV